MFLLADVTNVDLTIAILSSVYSMAVTTLYFMVFCTAFSLQTSLYEQEKQMVSELMPFIMKNSI